MSGFTKGPWRVADDWTIRSATATLPQSELMGDYKGNIVADLAPSVGHGPEGKSRLFAVPEAMANARLIAAAPSLYEALQRIAAKEQHLNFTCANTGQPDAACTKCIALAALALVDASASGLDKAGQAE